MIGFSIRCLTGNDVNKAIDILAKCVATDSQLGVQQLEPMNASQPNDRPIGDQMDSDDHQMQTNCTQADEQEVERPMQENSSGADEQKFCKAYNNKEKKRWPKRRRISSLWKRWSESGNGIIEWSIV
jgi:hypothetical protein